MNLSTEMPRRLEKQQSLATSQAIPFERCFGEGKGMSQEAQRSAGTTSPKERSGTPEDCIVGLLSCSTGRTCQPSLGLPGRLGCSTADTDFAKNPDFGNTNTLKR